eukprot:15075318-Alexandrium_andersonii.AAC.1
MNVDRNGLPRSRLFGLAWANPDDAPLLFFHFEDYRWGSAVDAAAYVLTVKNRGMGEALDGPAGRNDGGREQDQPTELRAGGPQALSPGARRRGG